MRSLSTYTLVRSRWTWLALVLVGSVVPAATPATEPQVVQIGMVKSIFRDVPDPVVKGLTIPFGALMYHQTGLNGQLVTCTDAFDLGEQLDKGKMDLGVFHGFEFAWAQEKFPNLKPLMIAVNQHRNLSVELVTRAGGAITTFDDLKGKKLSLPFRSREHCHLFLDRHCEKAGCGAEAYVGKIIRHANAEVGLDAVVSGEVDAAIVDGLSLECYGTIKPGCLPLLKTVEKSALFPAAAIVYREGALSQQTLDAFRKGMLNASKSAKSRGLMTLFSLTAFESVPADYQDSLDAIRKAYPTPAATATKTDGQ